MKGVRQRFVCAVALGAAVAFSRGDAAGQAQQVFCTYAVTDGALVSGHLVPTDDEASPERGVQIKDVDGGFSCATSVEEDGRFDFGLVPPGRYAFTLGTLGLKPIAPIMFDVDSQPVRLSIPISREDRIAACFTEPRCAAVLGRLTSLEASDAAEERILDVLGLRLAIVLAGESWSDDSTWAVCLDGDDETRLALQEVFARVEPSDRCERAESTPERPAGVGGWVRVIGTGTPAALVRTSIIERLGPEHYALRVSYTKGGLWGEGHRCEVRRVGEHWVPTACRLDWVS